MREREERTVISLVPPRFRITNKWSCDSLSATSTIFFSQAKASLSRMFEVMTS
jgi:hypothetical protein